MLYFKNNPERIKKKKMEKIQHITYKFIVSCAGLQINRDRYCVKNTACSLTV